MEDQEIRNELVNTAEEFSAQLRSLAVVMDADLSKVIRATILRVFSNVIKRSPVDTGAYRASHGIANYEQTEDEGIVKGTKGQKIPAQVALRKAQGWTWKVGDGNIYLFNNVPYAVRIEDGHSKRAAQGVYRLVIPEFTVYLQQELSKYSEFTGER